MLEQIDNFFQKIEGKKTISGTATPKRKTTTATRVKKSIRKKAGAAKKTATKRIKTVINSFVKSANASVTTALKPKKTIRKTVKKTITVTSVNNAGGTWKIYAKVNGLERSKKLLKADIAKFTGVKRPTAAQIKTLGNKYFNIPATRRKKSTPGNATGSKYHKHVGRVKAKRKSASNKGTARLKAITAKAKQIRKASPTKKWTTCISEASKKV